MPIIDSQIHAYEANTPKRPWHTSPNWPAHVTGDERMNPGEAQRGDELRGATQVERSRRFHGQRGLACLSSALFAFS